MQMHGSALARCARTSPFRSDRIKTNRLIKQHATIDLRDVRGSGRSRVTVQTLACISVRDDALETMNLSFAVRTCFAIKSARPALAGVSRNLAILGVSIRAFRPCETKRANKVNKPEKKRKGKKLKNMKTHGGHLTATVEICFSIHRLFPDRHG